MGRVWTITGVDGCGKTTICRWIAEELRARSIRTKVTWSRFTNYVSLPFLAATRVTGHNYYRKSNGTKFGVHAFETLGFWRLIFVVLQLVDVNLGAARRITIYRPFFDIILCERGPWDTVVDVTADTSLDQLLLLSSSTCPFTFQVHGRNNVVFLERDPRNILQSRPELADDHKLQRRIDIYRLLAKRNGWTIVDNNGDIAETKREVLQAVLSELRVLP